jgi:hypothetical protein
MLQMKDILINKMELEYNPENNEHVEGLKRVYQRLLLCGVS